MDIGEGGKKSKKSISKDQDASKDSK